MRSGWENSVPNTICESVRSRSTSADKTRTEIIAVSREAFGSEAAWWEVGVMQMGTLDASLFLQARQDIRSSISRPRREF